MRGLTIDLQRFLLAAAAVAITAAAGCSTTETPSSSAEVLALQGSANGQSQGLRVVPDLPPPSNTQDGQEQPLAPNDVLEVDVFQADSLDRTVQIDAAGRINLPLIGAVEVVSRRWWKFEGGVISG